VPEPESKQWVRLDADGSWMRVLQKISPFDFSPSDWWGLLIVIPLGILYFIALALIIPVLPRPWVNVLEHSLRIGRRTWDFAEVNMADLATSHWGKKRYIDLKFGRVGGAKLYVKLVAHDIRVLDGATRALLEQIIEGSSIPTQREHDATATSKYSYPTGLSRERALEAVRNPSG
jgi:hypothetical protein